MPMQGQNGMGFDQDTLNYLRNMGLFGGLGGAAGGLFNYFNQGRNPSDAANDYLNKIPGLQDYLSQYQKGGAGAYGNLQDQFGQLTNDPNAVYNKLAGGYKESPGYQFQLKQGLNAANAANAAGGTLGTPQNSYQDQQVAQGLANQDFQQYLGSVSGLYGKGLEGLGHLSDQGFQSNQDIMSMLANLYGAQGQYAYGGQAGKNAAKGNAIGNIFGGLGTGLGSLFGGGLGGLFGHLFGK